MNQKQAKTILDRSQKDPVFFCQQVLGCEPWLKQDQILESIRDNPRTSVRSCHGIGKSFIGGRAALWFLYSYPNSVVVTTAPTGRQVKKILWQEIRRAHAGAKYSLGGKCLTTEIQIAPGWFAFGFSTDDGDQFQGPHAEHILIIVDEAAGVNETIFSALEGLMTSDGARLLYIGNPTSSSGTFYDSHNSKRQLYHCISVSAFETPNFTQYGITIDDIRHNSWAGKITGPLPNPALVTPKWVYDRWLDWGEESFLWSARVLGEFPKVGEDTLIHLTWIEAAVERELPEGQPIELGNDVARYGSDKTIIFLRRGSVAKIYSETGQEDTMQTVGRAINALNVTNAEWIKVDGDGLGAGVVDRLAEQGRPVIEMHSGVAAIESDRFINTRAEWYWNLRELFRTGQISIPNDPELIGQLSALKYKYRSDGRIQIESKEDMKKRGLKSPDKADALCYTFAPIVFEDLDDNLETYQTEVSISPV
jgi:phage terminase large subunit